MAITHTFVSAKPAAADPTQVGSAEWNAVHTLGADDNFVTDAQLVVIGNTSGTNTGNVTIGTANGLSLVGQALSLGLASAGVTGALSGTDYNTFAAKQAALTLPLSAANGGTGVANGASATLTLPNFPITIAGGVTGGTYTLPSTAGGGTVALLNTANVFMALQFIDGSADVIQLRVQAVAGQTANLQTWENSAGTVLAAIQASGNFLATLGTSVENFFIGNQSGRSAATGTYNTGVGTLALNALTSGANNTALGYNALVKVNSGSFNTAMGASALQSLTTGTANIGFGQGSLLALISGHNNLGIGYNVMAQSKTTGDNNIGIGRDAMAFDVDGNNNTAIGNESNYTNTTGDGNITIGYRAGKYQTGDNYLLIANQDYANAAAELAKSIIYGVMAATPAAQTLRLNAVTSIVQETAATAAIVDAAIIQGESTGTAAAGFGISALFKLETATAGTVQNAGRAYSEWVTATNATRAAKTSITAFDYGAERIGFQVEGSGTATKVGVYGVATVARATNAGAAGAFVANTSLTANDSATYGGYTIGQIAQALINIGILT